MSAPTSSDRNDESSGFPLGAPGVEAKQKLEDEQQNSSGHLLGQDGHGQRHLLGQDGHGQRRLLGQDGHGQRKLSNPDAQGQGQEQQQQQSSK